MTEADAWARFDDLTTGRSLLAPPPRRVLLARRPAEVAGVLAEVDDATRAGSWAYGYVAYEAAGGLDPALPGAPAGPGEPPLVWFGLCAQPVSVPPVTSGTPASTTAPAAASTMRPWRCDLTDAEHRRAVEHVRARIADGETYQCNLTDRLRSTVEDPLALYARLALAQRGAYNAYLDIGSHVIASASPELFVEWAGDQLRTRPMKGTAARGRTTVQDEEVSRRLRASSKERAENLMIVDLLRNDLSRIARTGSVAVSDLFRLERYPTLWQLTSQVTATARPGTTLLDVFGALFPCGSVTGAPKQRTMALIRELEPGPRGVYCGAVGLLAPPGAPVRARFNVAIRTVVVDSRSGAAVYGAGGGITWDSDAAAERAELTAKAAVLSHDADDPDLLETLAFVPGEGLRNLDRHLARMLDSAAYLGYRLDPEEVTGALRAALAHAPAPARVRVTADRLGQVSVTLASLPPAPEGAVRLAVDEEPVDSASVWLAHKTTRREVYTSRARRHPHADDVVCLNERAELTETTVANLAVKLDGRWWTPPVACGALPGVERGRLVELGTLGERVLTVGDLHGAQELAVVSSLRGWRRAVLAPDPS